MAKTAAGRYRRGALMPSKVTQPSGTADGIRHRAGESPFCVTAGAGVQRAPDKVVDLGYVETCRCYCPQNHPHSPKFPSKSRSSRLNLIETRWMGFPGLMGETWRVRRDDLARISAPESRVSAASPSTPTFVSHNQVPGPVPPKSPGPYRPSPRAR